MGHVATCVQQNKTGLQVGGFYSLTPSHCGEVKLRAPVPHALFLETGER